MHFKHRYSTSDDLAIDITDGSVPWNPHKSEDEPYMIDYDNKEPVLVTDYQPVSLDLMRQQNHLKMNSIHTLMRIPSKWSA